MQSTTALRGIGPAALFVGCFLLASCGERAHVLQEMARVQRETARTKDQLETARGEQHLVASEISAVNATSSRSADPAELGRSKGVRKKQRGQV